MTRFIRKFTLPFQIKIPIEMYKMRSNEEFYLYHLFIILNLRTHFFYILYNVIRDQLIDTKIHKKLVPYDLFHYIK